MGIGDWGWGLGIGDWPNPQSPIHNSQSPIKSMKFFLLNLAALINRYLPKIL